MDEGETGMNRASVAATTKLLNSLDPAIQPPLDVWSRAVDYLTELGGWADSPGGWN
jgi:hypothetical protein